MCSWYISEESCCKSSPPGPCDDVVVDIASSILTARSRDTRPVSRVTSRQATRVYLPSQEVRTEHDRFVVWYYIIGCGRWLLSGPVALCCNVVSVWSPCLHCLQSNTSPASHKRRSCALNIKVPNMNGQNVRF